VCLEHQADVASLVLSGGLAHAPPWLVLQRTIARVTPERLLERALVPMYSGGSAEYAKIAVEDFRRCGKRAYLAALGELAELDLRPRLSRLSVPTLVTCGSNNRVNIPLSRELAAGIGDAELQIVPGATHLWNLQQPDTFNQRIAAFVQRTAS